MSTIAVPRRPRRVLPGFGLTLGISLLYLCLLVLIPLSTTFVRSATLGWHQFWLDVSDERVRDAFRLSFGAAFGAAAINVIFGVLLAWVLTRYPFPGRRLIDGLVDLPFALPTSVAGIALATIYADQGWFGHYLAHYHIEVAYTPLGIWVALIFIGLPFVVRTVQPVLEDLDLEIEEAAAGLGANRLQTLRRVIFPLLAPAILTGFALAFARALGEYGSVVFISSGQEYTQEIVPMVIMSKLEEYDYAGATAVAVVMLLASFILLFLINVLQGITRRRQGAQ